jgi:histidine triad (HIT) family protein
MARCIFCKIADGELPARMRFEDDEVIAFDDINPKAPVHILIVPKKHITSLRDAAKHDADVLGHMLIVAQQVAEEAGVGDRGYKVVINTGKEAGQLVDHLHMHLLGGKLLARMQV